MMDKFTTQFQSALGNAQSLAIGHDNQYIEPLHILSALLDESANLLQLANVNVSVLKTNVAEKINSLPKVSGNAGQVQLSQQSAQVLNLMDKQAQQNGDAFIASELFYPAILDSKDSAAQLLKEAGANKQNILAAIQKVRGGESVQEQNDDENRQALHK